jgi:hypothetical protein
MVKVSGMDTRQVWWEGSNLTVQTQTVAGTPVDVGGLDIEKEEEFAYQTVKKRIENLEAIERGEWTLLEEPLRRERRREVASLALMLVFLLAIAVVLLVPWKARSDAWEFATTNFISKLACDGQLDTIRTFEANAPSADPELSWLANFLSARLASGAPLSAGERTELEVHAALLKSFSEAGIKMQDSIKSKLEAIEIFGPDPDYRAYAGFRTQLVDATIHNEYAAGRFADDVSLMTAGGAFDRASIAARLQALQAESQQLAGRRDELRLRVTALEEEL